MENDRLAAEAAKLGELLAPLVKERVDAHFLTLSKELMPAITEQVDARLAATLSDQLSATISEISTGFAVAFGVLVVALDRTGALDRAGIAGELERALHSRLVNDSRGNVAKVVRELAGMIDVLSDGDRRH